MQTSWNRSVLLILLPFMACLLGISANAGTHASKKTATHKTVSKRSSPAVEAALRRSIRQSALAQRIESSEQIASLTHNVSLRSESVLAQDLESSALLYSKNSDEVRERKSFV